MGRLFLYIILSVFFLRSQNLFSIHFKITDSIDYLSHHKNIIHPYFQIGMVNDYNPLFNKHCDDDGYTLGLYLNARIRKKNSVNYLMVEYKSDLYTKYLKDDKIIIGPRTYYPQYFTEISSLSFHYQYFIEKYSCFFSLGFGAGINNPKEAIWGLALYVQGGKDGKGGYHSILENHPGSINISTDEIKPIIFVSPAIIKHFSILSYNTKKSKPYLELQTGTRLATKIIGSDIFLKAKLDAPVLQIYYNTFNLFMLSVILNNELTYSRDGFLTLPELGTEVRLAYLTIGFTSIFNIGKQNVSALKYVDKDILMRGYLTFNF